MGTASSGSVSAIAVTGSTVYVGGNFTTVGGSVAASSIGRWDGSTWSGMSGGVRTVFTGNDIPGLVRSLALVGSTLYVGGEFSRAGGSSVVANGIATWNGSSWSAVGSGVAGPAASGAGAVFALAVAGTEVYVSGYFTQAGGVACTDIAEWSGAAWSGLGSGVHGTTVNGVLYAVAVAGTDVYVGGQLSAAGTVAVKDIAKWSGTAWSALGTGLTSTSST